MEVVVDEILSRPWTVCFDAAAARKRKSTEDELGDDARYEKIFVKELRHRDAWYKKRLNDSDVSRNRDMLAVSKSWVVEQVLPYLAESAAKRIERGASVRVVVKDCELGSRHVLYMRKLRTGRFVFVGRWRDEFVIRRNLKKGDDIGLCWQEEGSMFSFTAFYRK